MYSSVLGESMGIEGWNGAERQRRSDGYVTGVKSRLIEFANDMKLGVVRSRGEDTIYEW